MLTKIKQWFGTYGAIIALVWCVLVGVYAESEPFRDYVLRIFYLFPRWLHELAAAVIVPIVFYIKRKRPEG